MTRVQFPLRISAILIDLDGTLLHTAPELAESANRMLRDMGRPCAPQDLLKSYIGNGISWLVKRALTGDMHAEPDVALYDKALPIFERHYTELLLQSKPFEGVLPGLDALKSAGFKLGCITNKVSRYTEPLLKGIGLARYFDIVLSGDSLNDAVAARAAGCPVFCVPYGYNHGEPVEGLDVDAVIPTLCEAVRLIRLA